MYTSQEYNVSLQRQRTIKAKIELLSFSFQLLDTLEGNVVGDPSFTTDATSDIRRSCSLAIHPTNSTFDIATELYDPITTKIWLNKYIRVSYGIEELRSGEVVYTNMGIYLINNPNQSYSAEDNTISLQLVDLMANMTGLRKGNIEGFEYKIPQGSDIRSRVIELIAYCGFTSYIIETDGEITPWEIAISSGGTIYEALTRIVEAFPYYQMYFDVNGAFHFEPIPSGVNEPIYLDDNVWSNALISYDKNTDFENVKNSIEVFGGSHDIQYYSLPYEIVPSVQVPNEWCFDVRIPTITTLDLNNIGEWLNVEIGFTSPYQPEEMLYQPNRIRINQTYEIEIQYHDSVIPTYKLDTYYVFYFKNRSGGGTSMGYMGEVQPYWKIEDTNPNSPFYVNGDLGKLRKVFSGGNYDNINSEYYARERAKYEFYLYNTLQNNITLTCKPLYYCDVNKVIEITLPNKQGTKITQKYITKNISTSGGVGGTQTIQCSLYMPTE